MVAFPAAAQALDLLAVLAVLAGAHLVAGEAAEAQDVPRCAGAGGGDGGADAVVVEEGRGELRLVAVVVGDDEVVVVQFEDRGGQDGGWLVRCGAAAAGRGRAGAVGEACAGGAIG